MHDRYDDYGEEPSWPVAVVVGMLAFVVGFVARVRDCLVRPFRRHEDPPEERSGPGDREA
ncbi:MAG: hypothetical protein E6R06_26345 [Mycobacterium sp.]|nr:MAG: hypothetical protein E6R06_26345 [Mycobacterium sp.]